MDEQEKPIRFYVDMAVRRKWFIIFPLAVSIVVAFAIYKNLPKIYRADTLILVQPHIIPESYVRPTITTSITDRLNTVSQEILSRTTLEKVIHTLNLYPDLRKNVSIEEVIEIMRKSIGVSLQTEGFRGRGQNTFSISYEGEEPQTVMDVVNQLASTFIEENIKAREQQAESTSIFLSKELSDIENQLSRKEAEIKNFRERNMGKLPQQLDANLRILERLQQQLPTIHTSIKAAEDRSLLFQNQIGQLKKPSPSQVSRTVPREQQAPREEILTERTPEDPVITQWNLLKRELNVARSKYTENHPDVIDLKRKISNLEPVVKEVLENQKAIQEARQKEMRIRQERAAAAQGRTPLETTEPMDPATERLLSQYHEQYTAALLEAERLRGEEKKLKEEILIYQARIEATPKLEQELTLLNRDYDLLKSTYQSLKDKRIQSQMAETFEKKHVIGGQFKILDPAVYPEKPVRPDRNRILMIGAIIGLLGGLGLAWFRESLDESFHSEEELEADLGLPILANLPNLKEERE
jgi:polysaccharide chain length determinant protein (PEP-CTERM system associated)